MVKTKQESVLIDTDVVPKEHKKVLLSVDIFFFNGLAFIITVCHGRFITAMILPGHKRTFIWRALEQMIKV